MRVTADELGRRLRAARESCGLTQDDVARQLGMSRPTVTQIELGNRAVTSVELDRLAYFFGRDIREFFAESFPEEDALAALFRAEPDIASATEAAEALRKCIALGREITGLERVLGMDHGSPLAVSYEVSPPQSRWEAVQQGESVADQERGRLGLGSAPTASLGELLETQGVRTGVVHLPDDVSGLTLSDRAAGMFIVVNRLHSPVRRRFSMAHEFGHVIFDRRRVGTVSRASDRDELIEVRANAFAAAFLLPADGVRQFVGTLGKGRPSRASAQVFDEIGAIPAEGRVEPGSQNVQLYDIIRIAHHFGTSRLTALFRLRNVKLVSEAEFEGIKHDEEAGRGRELARLLTLPDERDEDRNGFRHRILALALEAYRRDRITRAKFDELAVLLSMERRDIDELMDRAGLGGTEPSEVLIPGE